MDLLEVFKDEKRIGYIKAIYSNKKIFNEYYPTLMHHLFDTINQDYLINNEMSKKEILEVVEKRELDRNINYENTDEEFKRIYKKLSQRYKEELKRDKETIGTALSQYTKLKENYQGKGITQLMNFHLAKHFNSKNIILKSSLNQTEAAEKMWENIIKNFPESITKKVVEYYGRDKNIYYFNVVQQEDCYYNNGKLILENQILKILEKKSKTKSKIKRTP